LKLKTSLPYLAKEFNVQSMGNMFWSETVL